MKIRKKNPKLVILDRDGVINYDSDNYIKSVNEWRALPGSLEAIAYLYKQGIQIAIASNQSGLAREFFCLRDLNLMHGKMLTGVARLGGHIDLLAFCPHLPDKGCECRKPADGMLRQIITKLQVDASEALFVGDTHKDYLAARSCGLDFAMVKTGKGRCELNDNAELLSEIAKYDNLHQLVMTLFKN